MTVHSSGVVFDLFHTLIDPEPLYPPGFDKRAEVAAIAGVEPDALVAFWHSTYEERETSTIDLVDLFDRHCSAVGRALTVDARTRIDEVLGVAVDEAITRPDPAMVELVAELSDRVSIGVLSNCHEREVRHWRASPLEPYVSAFGRSSRIGAMKPDPRAYRWIIERLDIDPARSTYVGNGGSDELIGARTAGFGHVIHSNIYDQLGHLVPVDEQRRRSAHGDASVTTIDQLRVELGLTLRAVGSPS